MDPVDIAVALLTLEKGQRMSILKGALDEYMRLLYLIMDDIYESCIKDYYVKHTPVVYDRHENIEGFNLYQANDIAYNDLYLHIFINHEQLLPYGSEESEDVREQVLKGVLKGWRGTKSSRTPKGWPKKWRTSYPNQFSTRGGIWSSKKRTLENIIDDFCENVFDDTEQAFWVIVSKKI